MVSLISSIVFTSLCENKITYQLYLYVYPSLKFLNFDQLFIYDGLISGMMGLFIATSMTMVVDKFRSIQKITKPILKKICKTDRQALLLKFLRNLKMVMSAFIVSKTGENPAFRRKLLGLDIRLAEIFFFNEVWITLCTRELLSHMYGFMMNN